MYSTGTITTHPLDKPPASASDPATVPRLVDFYQKLYWYIRQQTGSHWLPPVVQLYIGCLIAERNYIKQWRQVAHTNHYDGVICCCHNLGTLPIGTVLGVLTHEFGHLAADNAWNDSCEANANAAAHDFFGLTIYYSDDAQQLEYLKEKDIQKILRSKRGC